eukprot:GEMP01083694.1.p1 GENE.GEMP01083694.1~~GEMP01083694.1.p1  ORF type:complete len:222 (-),score=35.08 GEMP01083694.1:356-997(-)
MRRWRSVVPAGSQKAIRVLHLNILADALARGRGEYAFRCPPEHLTWRSRSPRLIEEICRHKPDLVSLCEVDHFSYFQDVLHDHGFEGVYQKKRAPAKDGTALFARTGTDGYDLGFVKPVFLDGARPGSCVGAMVRVVPKDGNVPFAFAGVHLKAGSPDLENVRVQQLSNFFTALEDFARGQRIMLCADLIRHQLLQVSTLKNENYARPDSMLC